MNDVILQRFFEPERWKTAIERGIVKGIKKRELYALTTPEVRTELLHRIVSGKYEIFPPHIAEIPKDEIDPVTKKQKVREVCANEGIDRVVCSIFNDLLFELMKGSVHSACTSYQKGIGCGMVVQRLSRCICNTTSKDGVVGFKADLSKYFDSVPIEYIDAAFDSVEQRHGKSKLVDVFRKYYHSDLYFDVDNNLCSSYRSLKQGCAVAAWLADVVLYHIDDKLSRLNGYYVRYSDDIMFVGADHKLAMQILAEELAKMQMKLNPKKVEEVRADTWIKFLGFSIRGKDITMSGSRIKKFQKEIEKRTVRNIYPNQRTDEERLRDMNAAIRSVMNFLYRGNSEHSWATQVLPVINVEEDINTMNSFILDCFCAVYSGKKRIGGLGFVKTQKVGCINRGKGQNVRANRTKALTHFSNFVSLRRARNAMVMNKSLYRSIIDTAA